MSLPDRASPMTFDEFLAWRRERGDGERHELVAGRVVTMAAERNRHVLVKTDVASAMRRAVRTAGAGCTVFGDGATIRVDEADGYIPDVTVQCGGPVDLDSTVVTEPTILVEVLSPSTRSVDSSDKLLGYFQLPSVRHYLVIDPVRRAVIHHARTRDGVGTRLVHEGLLALDPPGIELDVADFFESVRAHGG